MNIQLTQVEKKSQAFSYMLAAFAVFTVVMLILSWSGHAVVHISADATSAQTENSSLPVAIPAPLPPAGQSSGTLVPESFENTAAVPAQAIAAPLPFVP